MNSLPARPAKISSSPVAPWTRPNASAPPEPPPARGAGGAEVECGAGVYVGVVADQELYGLAAAQGGRDSIAASDIEVALDDVCANVAGKASGLDGRSIVDDTA